MQLMSRRVFVLESEWLRINKVFACAVLKLNRPTEHKSKDVFIYRRSV